MLSSTGRKMDGNKIFLLPFYLLIFSEIFNKNRFIAAIRFTTIPTMISLIICVLCIGYRKRSFSLNEYIPLIWVGFITSVSIYLSSIVHWSTSVSGFYIFGLIYILMTCSDFSSTEIKHFIGFYVFLCLVISTQIYYNVATNNNYAFGRVSFSWFGVIKDQNMLSAFLAFGALSCFMSFLYNKKTKQLIYFVYIFAAMIMIGSRGGILTLVISSFIVMIKWLIDNESSVRKISISIVLFISISALLMILSNSGVFDRALNIENYTQDGREGLWKAGMKAFYDNPWIGSGYDSGNYYSAQYWNLGQPTHNSFIDLISSVGIIGSIAYLYYIIKYWKVSKGSKLLFFSMVVSLLLPMLFINGYGTISFIAPCALVTVIARYCRNNSIKDLIL